MTWIPVTENYPPQKEDVLIYIPKGFWGDTFITVAYYTCEHNKRRDGSEYDLKGWHVVGVAGYEYENDFNFEEVTHWAHLPGPPNG